MSGEAQQPSVQESAQLRRGGKEIARGIVSSFVLNLFHLGLPGSSWQAPKTLQASSSKLALLSLRRWTIAVVLCCSADSS
jgi:hypothetical protein